MCSISSNKNGIADKTQQTREKELSAKCKCGTGTHFFDDSGLRRHRKKCRCSSKNAAADRTKITREKKSVSTAAKCVCKCGRQFYDRSGLGKHRKKCTGSNNNNAKNGVADKRQLFGENKQCGLCSAVFAGFNGLCSHLDSVHDEMAKIYNLEFDCEEEFLSWKESESREALCKFKKRSSNTLKNGCQQVYFVCHRSGSYKSVDSGTGRGRIRNPSIKCGFDCSAFVTAHKHPNGKLTVQACLDHYGHDNYRVRLFPPKGERNISSTIEKKEQNGDEQQDRPQLEAEQQDRPLLEAELLAAADKVSSAPEEMLPQLRTKLSELQGLLDLDEVACFPMSVDKTS